MLCRHCGTDNQEGNLYCMKCGRKLDTDIPEASRGWAPQEARKKTYAQMATEEDARRREDRTRRREDGRTLAGIAAVITAAVLLLVGVSAGAYALLTHSGVDPAEEMNYASSDSAENAAGTDGTLSGTAETAQTEVSAQPSEAERVVVTPELSSTPSPTPTPMPSPTADAAYEVPDADADAGDGGLLPGYGTYGDPYDDFYDDPYGDLYDWDTEDDTEENDPEHTAGEYTGTDDDEEGPHGVMWDIITYLYSFGSEET